MQALILSDWCKWFIACGELCEKRTQKHNGESSKSDVVTRCTLVLAWVSCSISSLSRFVLLDTSPGFQDTLDIVPTHIAPSLTIDTEHNDVYSAYNKPGAVLHWLQVKPVFSLTVYRTL